MPGGNTEPTQFDKYQSYNDVDEEIEQETHRSHLGAIQNNLIEAGHFIQDKIIHAKDAIVDSITDRLGDSSHNKSYEKLSDMDDICQKNHQYYSQQQKKQEDFTENRQDQANIYQDIPVKKENKAILSSQTIHRKNNYL